MRYFFNEQAFCKKDSSSLSGSLFLFLKNKFKNERQRKK